MKRWWIGVVAAVGVVLAFLLFPRPDTGSLDIPPPDPSNTDPLDFQANAGADGTVRNPTVGKRGKRRRAGPMGEKPGMDRLVELRSRPEAKASVKLIGPWSTVRYVLMKEGGDDPEAVQLSKDIAPVLAALQVTRRDPTRGQPFEDTQRMIAQLEERLRATEWVDNERVQAALDLHDKALDEYTALTSGDEAADEEAP